MVMRMKRLKYLSPILVLIISGIFVTYQLLNYEALEEVEIPSALSKAFVAVLVLVGLFIIQNIREVERTYRVLMLGFTALFVSLVTDVLDEFLKQPDLITTFFEDLCQIIGYVLVIVGIWLWIIHNRHMTDELKQMAITDHLTGAHNTRQFGEARKQEINRAVRYAEALSLIMFDIDHSKRINDNFGHHAGDEVLRSVAEIVRRNIRVTDIFARIGGDEFTVLTSGTDMEGPRGSLKKSGRL